MKHLTSLTFFGLAAWMTAFILLSFNFIPLLLRITPKYLTSCFKNIHLPASIIPFRISSNFLGAFSFLLPVIKMSSSKYLPSSMPVSCGPFIFEKLKELQKFHTVTCSFWIILLSYWWHRAFCFHQIVPSEDMLQINLMITIQLSQ